MTDFYVSKFSGLNFVWKSESFCRFLKRILFIYLVVAFIALCGLFSSCGEWKRLFVAVHGLLIAVSSLIVEHGLRSHRLQ